MIYCGTAAIVELTQQAQCFNGRAMTPTVDNMDGIRVRLLVLVCITALPGFLLTLVMIHRERNLFEAKAKQKALQVLQQALLKEYNLVDQTEALLKQLSEQPQVVDSNPVVCNAFMAKIHQQHSIYTTFGAISPAGLVTCSAIPLPGSTRATDRSWFQQAIRTQSFAVGKYKVGRITNRPILSFGYPVIDSTKAVKAVVFASLDLSYINELVAVEQLPLTTTISIIDREGTILVRSPEGAKWIGKSIRDTPLFSELRTSKGKTVTAEASDVDGVSRIYALGRLLPQDVPDLTIVIGIPESSVQSQSNRDLRDSLLLVSLITGLALVSAGWFSQQSIQRPITRLQAVTHQLAEGNLQVRVQSPYGPGKLGQLAIAFNEMADALERYLAERANVQREQERAELELRFVSIVSHELRSPLSALKMVAELLETFGEQITEERKQFYFQQLGALVNQMTQLMDDVLLIRRAEVENLATRPSRLDLENFCRSLIRHLQTGMNQARAIAVSCQGDCATVFLDEALLRSILTNLLTNALKYSSPESTVHLDLSCTEQAVVIQIRDEGIGIPADDQIRLFEMFYRAGNVNGISGTGLGLAIVKRFVECLDGEITFESVVGVGTTFTVILPLLSESEVKPT
jgi:signal transduction histidine kinase